MTKLAFLPGMLDDIGSRAITSYDVYDLLIQWNFIMTVLWTMKMALLFQKSHLRPSYSKVPLYDMMF